MRTEHRDMLTRLFFLRRAKATVDKDLMTLAPALVEDCVMAAGSLRGLAASCGISPSYLSLIRHGKTRVSHHAYIVLAEWAEENVT